MIQVAYEISNPKTLKREVSALMEAASELHCKNLLLTWDDEKLLEENNLTIRILPVWKWLLANK